MNKKPERLKGYLSLIIEECETMLDGLKFFNINDRLQREMFCTMSVICLLRIKMFSKTIMQRCPLTAKNHGKLFTEINMKITKVFISKFTVNKKRTLLFTQKELPAFYEFINTSKKTLVKEELKYYRQHPEVLISTRKKGKKPSKVLPLYRDEIIKIIVLHGGKNPFLYGSVARGEDTYESDIDIFAEAQDKNKGFDFQTASEEATTLCKLPVNISDKSFFQRSFMRRVRKDAKAL